MENKNEYKNQSYQQDWNEHRENDRFNDNQNRYQRYSNDRGFQLNQDWQNNRNRGNNWNDHDQYNQYNNRNRDYRNEYDRPNYERNSGQSWREDYRGSDWNPNNESRNYNNYERGNYGSDYRNNRGERTWWDRTSDEISSWFGDDDAERRRRLDKINGPHSGKGPKGYSRSDARIAEDINEKLYHDSYVDASDIEVKVSEGEVTLTGTVDSRNVKRRAEDIAEGVAGVKNVQNQLKVNANAANTSSNNPGNAYNSFQRSEGDQNGKKRNPVLS